MGEKKKILIADDEASLTEAMASYFSELGFEAAVASDGIEAVEKAKALKPNIILLDIFMPHLDGIEALRRLKEDPETSGIPVVMLTNVDTQGRVAEALELGCAHYLVKSNYGLRDLSRKVFEVIEQHLMR